MSPYRACDVKRKGYDRTQVEHVAVVFFDELEPFIAGCVSLDSQVIVYVELDTRAIISTCLNSGLRVILTVRLFHFGLSIFPSITVAHLPFLVIFSRDICQASVSIIKMVPSQ